MEFKATIDAMDLEQLQARAAEIDATETNDLTTEQLTALSEERDYVGRKLAELRMAAMKEAEKRAKIANDENLSGHKVPADKETKQMNYNDASPEYRSAFHKAMTTEGFDPEKHLTAEERTAYTAVTTDTTHGAAYVLPRTMVNAIWDLVEANHSILGDITMYRTNTILEVPYRSAITQGDAANKDEGVANDDEINEFAKVTLNGKDFCKTVKISYAMAKMSIDAFETYLTNEIAERIGAALSTEVVTQITSDYYSTGNAVNSSNVKAATYKDIAGVMALLENAKGQCVVYGKRATIYNYLVGMVDSTGRPIYQPDAQAGREGFLIGCPVKVEEAVAANKLLIGFPQNVVGNMVQDIEIEPDRHPDTRTIWYTGYARFECKLMAAKSFALYTVKQS